MYIAIDFDGTIADHRFPDIGMEVPGAFEWIKKFQAAGAKIILYTMRSNVADGNYLTEAINYCKCRGVEFWAHNHNPNQAGWTISPKVYANIYIDDAAFNCPLKQNPRMGGRPYVNWDKVGPAVYRELMDKS